MYNRARKQGTHAPIHSPVSRMDAFEEFLVSCSKSQSTWTLNCKCPYPRWLSIATFGLARSKHALRCGHVYASGYSPLANFWMLKYAILFPVDMNNMFDISISVTYVLTRLFLACWAGFSSAGTTSPRRRLAATRRLKPASRHLCQRPTTLHVREVLLVLLR